MEVKEIQKSGKLFEAVIDLHRKNSSTLGHLTIEAFQDAADKQNLLGAVDTKNNLLGYLLYRVAKTKQRASITHLCVAEEAREKGIGRLLVETVKERTKHLRGICLFSRRDYDSNRFWPRMNFVAKGEKPGRGKEEKYLTFFWFPHPGFTDLFEWSDQCRIDEKSIKVVLDANVFFDLGEELFTKKIETAHALESDWLLGEIVYCLTPEIYNEINRQENKDKRELARDRADSFPKVSPKLLNLQKFNEIQNQLKQQFPSPITASDKSDLVQLTYTILDNSRFFLTEDGGILDRSDWFLETFDLLVLRPGEFIAHFYEILNDIDYQPAKLAGSQIVVRHISLQDAKDSLDIFQNSKKQERKSNFNTNIQYFLSQPETCESFMVCEDNYPIAMAIIDDSNDYLLKVQILRTQRHVLERTIITHLVLDFLQRALDNQKHIVQIVDDFLSDEIIDILQENNFECIGNRWIKITISGALKAQEVISKLEYLTELWEDGKFFIPQIISRLNNAINSQDVQELFLLEHVLWPLKILDAEIPTFIVSIKPHWAKDLFDKELGEQTLFGSDLHLVINRENVYYRSARNKILTTPGRVLWYVTDTGTVKGYQNVKSLRACSHIETIDVGLPKDLFRRHKRIGVYNFKDLMDVTNDRTDIDVMAFRFSGTHLLPKSIPLGVLNQILGTRSSIMSPRHITQQQFLMLYRVIQEDTYG